MTPAVPPQPGSALRRTAPRRSVAAAALAAGWLAGLSAALVLSTASAADAPPPAPPPASPAALSVAAAGVPVGVVAGLAVVMLVPAATCFAKVLVVGYILRAGLSGGGWAGAGTVLPAAVLHSAAAVLTLLVMRPVAAETWAAAAADRDRWAAVDWADRNAVGELSARLAEPLRRFLFRNTREADRAHLAGLSARMAERRAEGRPEAEAAAEAVAAPGEESLEVLLPAFLASELRRAFRIGVLVCLPFLIVDLLAAAALAALGAPMMPPTAVSLPLKLLLFTAADGWPMLMRGLLLAYR